MISVCVDEPIQPIDPAAWVSHSAAMSGSFPVYPGSASMSSMTSSTSVTETECELQIGGSSGMVSALFLFYMVCVLTLSSLFSVSRSPTSVPLQSVHTHRSGICS